MAEDGNLKVMLIGGLLDTDSPSIYAVDLAGEMIRRGLSVRFVCAGTKCDAAESDIKRINGAARTDDAVLELPGLSTPLLSIYKKMQLKRFARSYKPKLVHALCEDAACAASSVASACNIPYLVTCHTYSDDPPSDDSRHLFRMIAVSDALREYLVNKAGVHKEKMIVLPNGVNLRRYDPLPSEESDRVPVIGGFGSLVERKGFEYLLRACSKVIEAGHEIHVLIAGEGPQEQKLRKLVRELKMVDKVTFSRYPFRAHSVIKEMDVFVMSSVRESLGFSALEALAYAKPVVSFGVGGAYSFLRHEKTGLLCNAKDVDALAAAIERLVDDPELRTKLGKAGRKFVEENFSLEAIAERLVHIYRQAVSQHKGANGAS
ncbi:MAG: glycosyltransferase family 4 protein [Planctomycetota bacterium]|nr:glycosyltransferase family 4 protein [Planctomycetota bacterium]